MIPARNSPKEISGANGKFLPRPQYERIYWGLGRNAGGIFGHFQIFSGDAKNIIFKN